MTPAAVVAVLDRLDEAGIECWVEGGWGVDALLSREVRCLSVAFQVANARAADSAALRERFGGWDAHAAG